MKKILVPLFLLGLSLLMGCPGKTPIMPVSLPPATPTPSISGVVSTLAGSAGVTGSMNGVGTGASFYNPNGVATDSSGNIYVADTGNNMIRKITPDGAVTTFAGSVTQGYLDATGTAALFNHPDQLTVDSSGNVYVADSWNFTIRKISPAGAVTTLAGSTTPGATNATGTSASFLYPSGVAVDGLGNVYVGDWGNNLIRKITPGGVVSTLAGSGSAAFGDGQGTGASFNHPTGVAVDVSGNVYVADTYNDVIRKITPGGAVTTLAGSAGVTGATNATGTAALFYYPSDVAVDNSGNIYVSDGDNNMIREITPGGVVSTLAGSAGVTGAMNATGTSASFSGPQELALDGFGDLYVADWGNNMIRKIR